MSSLKLKKRWFVLTHNSLDYYKSSEKNALKLGTLVLTSLCSVVPPDEKIFKETGSWVLSSSHGLGLVGAKGGGLPWVRLLRLCMVSSESSAFVTSDKET